MIKIKTLNKTINSRFLKVGETGYFKTEEIRIKIGRKEYTLYTIDHYKEWNGFGKIKHVVERSIDREERKSILMNILKEYTDKEIKDIDKILWYIEAGKGYKYSKRGSKYIEGIKVN